MFNLVEGSSDDGGSIEVFRFVPQTGLSAGRKLNCPLPERIQIMKHLDAFLPKTRIWTILAIVLAIFMVAEGVIAYSTSYRFLRWPQDAAADVTSLTHLLPKPDQVWPDPQISS